MSKTIYIDDECNAVIEEARNTSKGKIPKVAALRNLLLVTSKGVKRVTVKEEAV